MKLRFLMINILVCHGLAWAQNIEQASPEPVFRKVTLYINEHGELTSAERSVVRRETTMDLETLMISGLYKDYNKEGKLIADGSINEGVMRGLHTHYFENGRVKSTIEYDDNGFIVWNISNEKGESQVTHGTGKFSLTYDDSAGIDRAKPAKNKTVIGEFVKGHRYGTWIYLDGDGQKTDEEFYEDGKLSNRIKFDESGATYLGRKPKNTVNFSRDGMETLSFDKGAYHSLHEYFKKNVPGYPGVAQRHITYPGGFKKMLLYISQNVAISQSGEVYPVRLRVDEDGVVSFRFQPFLKPDLEAQFTQVLNTCRPKILPAVKGGKPISSSLRIPISNATWWIDFLKTASNEEIYNYVKGIWYNR